MFVLQNPPNTLLKMGPRFCCAAVPTNYCGYAKNKQETRKALGGGCGATTGTRLVIKQVHSLCSNPEASLYPH